MHLVTPSEIKSVAWEGELKAPPATMMGAGRADPVVVTIGKPEVWPVADALEIEVGKKWTPPLGGAEFWLLRVACTLHEPAGWSTLSEVQQRLFLRPRRREAGADAAYAFSLFPERQIVESKAEFTASLGPKLKFSEASVEVGEVGATFEYRKVFPIIQSYGLGEPMPYWLFKSHTTHPLDGSQFVFAVLAAKAGAGGIRASTQLLATVQTRVGPVRLGTPEEAHAHLSFDIP